MDCEVCRPFILAGRPGPIKAEPKPFKIGDRVYYDGQGTDYYAPAKPDNGTIVGQCHGDFYPVKLDNEEYCWEIKPAQLTLIDNSITVDLKADAFEVLTTLRNIDALLDRALREPVEETDEPVAKHTFNRAVDAAFAASQAISNQRAGEYKDSWSTDNQSTHLLDATLRLIDGTEDLYALGDISKEAKRLLMLASMVDVKISRMGGPWKADSFEDALNYLAAYTTLAKEYQGLA
jgi:hypothetical protein